MEGRVHDAHILLGVSKGDAESSGEGSFNAEVQGQQDTLYFRATFKLLSSGATEQYFKEKWLSKFRIRFSHECFFFVFVFLLKKKKVGHIQSGSRFRSRRAWMPARRLGGLLQSGR